MAFSSGVDFSAGLNLDFLREGDSPPPDVPGRGSVSFEKMLESAHQRPDSPSALSVREIVDLGVEPSTSGPSSGTSSGKTSPEKEDPSDSSSGSSSPRSSADYEDRYGTPTINTDYKLSGDEWTYSPITTPSDRSASPRSSVLSLSPLPSPVGAGDTFGKSHYISPPESPIAAQPAAASQDKPLDVGEALMALRAEDKEFCHHCSKEFFEDEFRTHRNEIAARHLIKMGWKGFDGTEEQQHLLVQAVQRVIGDIPVPVQYLFGPIARANEIIQESGK